MKQMFSNATVSWSEYEIERRESLIREITALLKETFTAMNPAIKFERCETPIITPAELLRGHIDAKFNLIQSGAGYLRPETTAGTYQYFRDKFHDENMMIKRLPWCMWQAGISFRDEANADTMRATKLRLRQFYQLEYQLFAQADTKADYIQAAGNALVANYGGNLIVPSDLPHYSEKTIDWIMGELEVAGMSIRRDWPHGKVYEISIGLDRLVALNWRKA